MPEAPRNLAPLDGVPHGDFQAFARVACTELLGEALPPDAAGEVADRAFTFPVPVVEVEPGVLLMELFHGPTLAFKDVGARFMASVLEGLGTERDDGGRETTILVATSGDTGGAVAAAFHGRPGFRVVVLFPAEGVSPQQRRQMTTLGGNVCALAVRGSFDDCQRLVKEALGRVDLAECHGLTSANSINVARLLPQTLYYAYAAALLDAAPHFVVPSGNLGNLCAGLLAARWGLRSAARHPGELRRRRSRASVVGGGPR